MVQPCGEGRHHESVIMVIGVGDDVAEAGVFCSMLGNIKF